MNIAKAAESGTKAEGRMGTKKTKGELKKPRIETKKTKPGIKKAKPGTKKVKPWD